MTVQPQHIQLIPLNKLVASPRNVRRKERKADIEALAASIASHGLLQNLCVVAADGDRFEVDAGGRRLLALKHLAKTGGLAKTFAVPCHVMAEAAGVEASLAENIHRVAMDAMDEVDAYARLIAEGSDPEDVARRFGVTRRHVDQRLALAGLSPKIKAAWKRGEVTLDVAKAFCLVFDHAQQEAVFRSLRRPITHAPAVRARLMDGRMRSSDALAVFVGLDVYEAAGGTLLRDLFDTQSVFIDNPALLTKLAEDRLAVAGERWRVEGWSWIDCLTVETHSADYSATRLRPHWRDPTVEEQAELDRIKAEIDKLDDALEASSVDDDPRWSMRDDLEAAYELVRQAGRIWSTDTKEVAGVVLSIDRDGALQAMEGVVRAKDQKRADALLKLRRACQDERDETDEQDGGGSSCDAPAHVSALSRKLNRDLTAVRTQAIRLALAGDQTIALALCVAAMARHSLHRAAFSGVAIASHARHVDDLPELAAALSELQGLAPADELELLDWALEASRDGLLAVLAFLVASAVDLAHEDVTPADLRRQAIADRLAQRLDIDMRAFWSADVDFWVRLPKSALLEALADAPGFAQRSERARKEAIKAHGKLRKEDLAARVSALYAGSGYLPDILVTPLAAGRLDVTADGEALIAQTAIAAE